MTKYDRDAYDNCVQFYCYNKVRFGRQFYPLVITHTFVKYHTCSTQEKI